MKKDYFKKISMSLVITLGMTLLPARNNIFADEIPKQIINQQDNEKEEASIVKEIEELREEYSKKFLKSDGTFEAVVYNKPIHYKDGDKWIEIDNTLKEGLDEELKKLDEENVSNINIDKEIDSIKKKDIEKEASESIKDNKDKENIVDEINKQDKDEINKQEKDNVNKENTEKDKDLDNKDKNKNKEKLEDVKETNKNEKKEKELKENNKEEQKKSKLENNNKKIKKDEVNNILTNENNKFSVNISKYSDSKKLIKIYKGDYELSWGMENVNPVKYEEVLKDENSVKDEIEEIINKKISENNDSKSNEEIEKDKNIIRENEEKKTLKNISTGVNYKNIFKNIDLNYTIDSNIIKENIIINNIVDSAEFEFNIGANNLIAKQNEHGIKFYDSKNQEKEVFSIEKPYMYDKKGDDSRDIKLEFKETEDGYKLKLIANKEWINSKERTFPIVIDPIVNTSQVRTDIFDTFVRENDAENKYDNQFLRAGNNYGSVTRSYLKFNIPSFDTANTITGAYMNLVLYNSSSTNQINVHKVTGQYSTSVSNGYVHSNLLWSNKPSYDSRIEDYQVVSGQDKLVSFDITRIVKEWYTSGVNNGLMIKSNDESISDAIFWSSDMHDAYRDYRPVIQYNYINNSGLEGYWTYHSQDVGRLGTGHINDYNGNLVFVQPLISDAGNRMPVSISLIYNSKQKNNKDISGNPLGFGNGWRLNLSQRVVKVNVSGEDYYKYIDSDGTEHYFKYESSSGKYKDLSGIDLTMELNYNNGYDNGYLIKDKKDIKYMFTASGYLYKMEDTNKNTITLQYQGSKLKYVVDGVGRITTLDLLDNGYLVGITDSSGRKISFGYKGIQLNSIKYNDNKVSIINYDSSDRLIEAQNYDGYKVKYEYSSGVDSKVSKSYEVFNDGTIGKSLTIKYGYNTTSFIDLQGRKEVYQFNNWGNTTSVIDANGNGTYYRYGEISNVNKLQSNSKLQNTVTNYLLNHNNEVVNTQWNYEYWGDSNGKGEFTTEEKYLGNNALKITKNNTDSSSFFNQATLLEKGKTYTFSGYVKAKNISSTSKKGAGIFLNYQNKDGSYSTVESNFLSGSTDWERANVTFTLPTDAASNYVYFRAGIIEGTGVAYIDCLQVEEGITANRYNLVENPSFKVNGNQANSIYWSAGEYDSSNDLAYSTDSTYPTNIDNSKTVYKMSGFSNKNKNVYQSIPVSGKKGDVFVAAGWAKGDSVPLSNDRYFALDVGIQRLDGSYKWYVIPFNEDTDEWQYAADQIVADSDYKSVAIYGLYYKNANTVYFDNFQLYKEEFSTSYQYDSKGNVISTKDLAKKNNTFEYNGTNDLIKATDPKGGSYTYTYDDKHNVKTATSAENIVYSFDYDANGNPIKSTVTGVNLSTSASATYTSNNNYIRTITNETGSKTTYNYDDEAPGSNDNKAILKGNVTSITDTNNSSTFYKYDNNTDALTKVYKTVDGKEISNSYTYENDKLKTINHNGFNYTFNYDKAGNNSEVLVGNQKLITNNLNILTGNLDSSTYGNGHIVTYQYDKLDRLIGKKFNGDTENRYTYDYNANGNLALKKDNTTNISTRYLYDFSDRLSKITDSNNNIFKVNYDLNNNVSDYEEVYNGYKNFKTSYIYDKDNNQKEINYTTDSVAKKISFNYDTLGRITSKNFNIGDKNLSTTYNYLKGSVSSNVGVSYQGHVQFMEWQGLVENYAICGTTGQSLRLEAIKINLTNPLSGMKIKYQAHVSEIGWQNWVYDGTMAGTTGMAYPIEAIRIMLEGAPEGYHIKYQVHVEDIGWQDPVVDGEMAGTTGKSKRIEAIKISVIKPESTETNKVSSIVNGNEEIKYAYDANGNIETITDVTLNKNIKYTYNELNELIREDNGTLDKTITYTYDDGGNILSKSEYKYTTGELGQALSTKSYEYGDTNWKDKLTSYNGKVITYDAIGNPLTYDGYTYSWEGGRRLKGISGNNKNISYKYNDSGIRTEKVVNGVKTSYTLSGDSVLLETTNDEKIHYTYDSSNNLISMNITSSSTPSINGEYYYIRNLQGDIIGLIDKSGAEVVSYTYDTWGKLISIEGSLKDTVGVKNPYRYRGYRYDTETGLYYLNARYYNPEWGRFINADALGGEIGKLLSHNGFAYCMNNPVNMEDPTGNIAWWIIGAGIGAVAGGIGGAIYSYKKTGSVDWRYVAGGAVGGALIGAGAGYLAQAAYGAIVGTAATTGAAAGAAQIMENARRLGQQGEKAANIVKNTERIKSLTNTANYRIPDALSETTLTEIKNVRYQALTNQIKDFILWAEQEGLEFVLKTRPDTKISVPLQNLIDKGKVIHLFIGD